jgi:hypothetical protein
VSTISAGRSWRSRSHAWRGATTASSSPLVTARHLAERDERGLELADGTGGACGRAISARLQSAHRRPGHEPKGMRAADRISSEGDEQSREAVASPVSHARKRASGIGAEEPSPAASTGAVPTGGWGSRLHRTAGSAEGSTPAVDESTAHRGHATLASDSSPPATRRGAQNGGRRAVCCGCSPNAGLGQSPHLGHGQARGQPSPTPGDS